MNEGDKDGSLQVGRPDLLQNFIIGTVLWWSVSFLHWDLKIDIDRIIDAYLEYLMHGIGTKADYRLGDLR